MREPHGGEGQVVNERTGGKQCGRMLDPEGRSKGAGGLRRGPVMN